MDITHITQNINQVLRQAQFIGVGSTRKVYRFTNVAIKTFLHPIGYSQSQNELHMYNLLVAQGLADHIAPVLYLDEQYMFQPYFEQLPLINYASA
ncbi:hypothetical protein [Metasolibacillus meyeri]|uniref:hypothetical protein n=1 Tax=Metasolibacillus meyeri TaxID=1071052 RepID=UPI000D302578|nr:hypothetical protein [Metasolibacillus meyeri]